MTCWYSGMTRAIVYAIFTKKKSDKKSNFKNFCLLKYLKHSAYIQDINIFIMSGVFVCFVRFSKWVVIVFLRALRLGIYNGRTICSMWSEELNLCIIFALISLLQFFLPLLVITLCNSELRSRTSCRNAHCAGPEKTVQMHRLSLVSVTLGKRKPGTDISPWNITLNSLFDVL